MKPNQIICGSNIEVVKSWPPNCIDSIVTDPPYGLGFMGKDWDTFKQENVNLPKTTKLTYKTDYKNGVPVKRKNPEMVTRDSGARRAGSYDLSRNPEFQQWFTVWAKAMLRITKPGGFLLCFGGTRTYHRLTCAIEDAGWQIRDCMMWLYGSGFPKSHNIGKAIDKTAGAEREIVGTQPAGSGPLKTGHVNKSGGGMSIGTERSPEIKITVPTTDLARLWDGYGTALKPAWEPIIVAMKPLDGTFARNAERHGVAGLNIDGGRIGTDIRETTWMSKNSKDAFNRDDNWQPKKGETTSQGRWPANLILDEEAGAILDEQSGTKKSGFMAAGTKRQMSDNPNKNTYGRFNPDTVRNDTYGDRGGASRFFKIIQGDNKCINANTVAQSLSPQKKQGDSAQKHAATSEAQEGVLSPEESQVIQDSTTNSKECIQPQNPVFGVEEKDNIDTIQITTSLLKSSGSVLPATKQDTPKTKKSEPSRFRYCAKTSRKERNMGMEDCEDKLLARSGGAQGAENRGEDKYLQKHIGLNRVAKVKNNHPTVKPLALMKYLCTLLKMPSAEQVILDPFLGSGTTGMACRELGINFVGIEKEPEYCEIAVRRIAAVEGIHPVVLLTDNPPAEVPQTIPCHDEHRQSIIDAASAELRRNRK